jgi:hypothetical protein
MTDQSGIEVEVLRCSSDFRLTGCDGMRAESTEVETRSRKRGWYIAAYLGTAIFESIGRART